MCFLSDLACKVVEYGRVDPVEGGFACNPFVFYSSNIIWQNSCDLSKKKCSFSYIFQHPHLSKCFSDIYDFCVSNVPYYSSRFLN
jgi:hypothetical protein